MPDPTDRIDELESRLAFQDDLIESLNEVVSRQDRVVLDLSQRVAQLEAKLEDMADATPGGAGEGHEPPPHY